MNMGRKLQYTSFYSISINIWLVIFTIMIIDKNKVPKGTNLPIGQKGPQVFHFYKIPSFNERDHSSC